MDNLEFKNLLGYPKDGLRSSNLLEKTADWNVRKLMPLARYIEILTLKGFEALPVLKKN